LSPRGDQLALAEVDPDSRRPDVRVLDLARGAKVRITYDAATDASPVWSPDGAWIALQQRVGSNTEICLIRPDGSDWQDLSQNSARDIGAAFSSDGAKIIFTSNRLGNSALYQIYSMNIDGSDQRVVYSDDAMSGSPNWSVDSHDIFFTNDSVGGRIGNFEIFKFTPGDPASLKRLTYRSRADGEPVLSPDGNRIAFTSNQDGNTEIYVMNSDGSALFRVTRDPGDDFSERWTPDGSGLIFCSNRSGRFAIYEIEL
jgi:TolB protein